MPRRSATVRGHAWLDEEDRQDLDAYRRIADRLNLRGSRRRGPASDVAYHNHDFEFTPMENRLPYDVLLQSTDPRHVLLELDLYWITKGGQDPLAYFARWPGRFRLVHVKDSAGPPEHRWRTWERAPSTGAGSSRSANRRGSSTTSWSTTSRRTPSQASRRVMDIFAICDSEACPMIVSYRHLPLILLLALPGFIALRPVALDAQQWPIHDMDRPLPPVVDPGAAGRPPSDAVVLFGDG